MKVESRKAFSVSVLVFFNSILIFNANLALLKGVGWSAGVHRALTLSELDYFIPLQRKLLQSPVKTAKGD